MRADARAERFHSITPLWEGLMERLLSRGLVFIGGAPLEWQRDSEMSPVINGLGRHVFTRASEGISSLSIHRGVTPRSQRWINQSSAQRRAPRPLLPPTTQNAVSSPPAVLLETREWPPLVQGGKKKSCFFLLKCRILPLSADIVLFFPPNDTTFLTMPADQNLDSCLVSAASI